MEVATFGVKKYRRGKPIPRQMLTESVMEAVYELEITTKGIQNPATTIDTLKRELYNRFKAQVIWAEVRGDTIRLQLVGSPFAWAALLAALPSILLLIGVVLVLVAVYTVFAAVPRWAWGVLITGVILIVFGPAIAKGLTPRS